MPVRRPVRRVLVGLAAPLTRRTRRLARAVALPRLPTAAFVDVVFVVIVTVLVTLEAATARDTVPRRPWLPISAGSAEILDAPLVDIRPTGVDVDGLSVLGEDEAAWLAASGRVHRLESLFDLLGAKREVWAHVRAGEPFPGVLVLMVDDAVPALVVKSVVGTAARAGYPHVSFFVGASR